MKQGRCGPKCRSNDITANVRPLDLGHSNAHHAAQLATYANPDASLFKGRQSTTIAAWVCAQCGYAEFYADDPRALKDGEG
jgi:predicted nucleic-acid-binding Zn-ribbon protein